MKYIKIFSIILILSSMFFIAFQVYLSKKILTRKKININGLSRYYYMSNRNLKLEKDFNILIFLHGLEDKDGISENTLKVFKEMEKKARKNNLILLFPMGIKGAFPSSLDLLAWGPDKEVQNLDFINQLVDDFNKRYFVSKVILGGFSNGAYFVSEILNSDNKRFSGYWLQAGGSNKEINNDIKSNIVLEAGSKDPWHLKSMINLKNQLINNGWILNEDLIYRELNSDHNLNIKYFNENVAFLLNDQKSNY